MTSRTRARGDRPTDKEARQHPHGDRLELECGVCGFRGSTLGPGDAIVAIRSFPRRYRAGFGVISGDDFEGGDVNDVLTRRPQPDSWSALELAGHVRDVFHAKEKRLRRVHLEHEPMIGEEQEIPPSGVDDQGPEAVLSALQYNAEQLARVAEGISGKDWARTGTRRDETVTALDLLREAVHEGSHRLRDLDRALRAARVTAAR